ncbi:uncharacterized protein V6R79_002765 [Siganus canaliculatus]
MSLNSSSIVALSPPPSSFISIFSFLLKCQSSTVGIRSLCTLSVTSALLLLPLCVLVVLIGVRRWRQRDVPAATHCDVFTYNVVAMELTSVLGSGLMCCGVLADVQPASELGTFLMCTNLSAQVFLQTLTCVDRYLAVVHPVTYLSLRTRRGTRIRNGSIACLWPFCVVFTGLIFLKVAVFTVFIVSALISLNLLAICFCSVSVLRVLIRPGPGEGGGARQRVDQSKLRAFYTIMVILGSLVVRLGGNVVIVSLVAFANVTAEAKCVVWMSILWMSVPSSLVLPLLFLHRAGMLPCRDGGRKTSGKQSR